MLRNTNIYQRMYQFYTYAFEPPPGFARAECKFAQVTALVPKVFAHLETTGVVCGFPSHLEPPSSTCIALRCAQPAKPLTGTRPHVFPPSITPRLQVLLAAMRTGDFVPDGAMRYINHDSSEAIWTAMKNPLDVTPLVLESMFFGRVKDLHGLRSHMQLDTRLREWYGCARPSDVARMASPPSDSPFHPSPHHQPLR